MGKIRIILSRDDDDERRKLRGLLDDDRVSYHHDGPETERIGAQLAALRAGYKRYKIVQALIEKGPMTCYELAIELGTLPNYISGLLGNKTNSLEKEGWIYRTGRRRKGPAPSEGEIWDVTAIGREQWYDQDTPGG